MRHFQTIYIILIMPVFMLLQAQETTETIIADGSKVVKSGKPSLFIENNRRTALMLTSEVMKGHYRFAWKMKMTNAGEGGKVRLRITLDGETYRFLEFFICDKLCSYNAFFYNAKKSTAKLLFSVISPKKDVLYTDMTLSNLSMSDFQQNLLSDGEFEQPASLPVEWGRCWGKELKAIVSRIDNVSDERALQLTCEDKNDAVQVFLPAILDKTYEVSFWGKSDKPSQIGVYLFSSGKGNVWHQKKWFELTPNWKRYVWKVQIPSDEHYSALTNRLVRLIFRPSEKMLPGKFSLDKISFRALNL